MESNIILALAYVMKNNVVCDLYFRGVLCIKTFVTTLPKAYRARPGFEPGTSRTLSENHTPRPTSHVMKPGLKRKSVFPLA